MAATIRRQRHNTIPAWRSSRVPTVKQRIAMAVKQAEDRLVAVKRAQEILAKNPDLEELLDIMQRSHF